MSWTWTALGLDTSHLFLLPFYILLLPFVNFTSHFPRCLYKDLSCSFFALFTYRYYYEIHGGGWIMESRLLAFGCLWLVGGGDLEFFLWQIGQAFVLFSSWFASSKHSTTEYSTAEEWNSDAISSSTGLVIQVRNGNGTGKMGRRRNRNTCISMSKLLGFRPFLLTWRWMEYHLLDLKQNKLHCITSLAVDCGSAYKVVCGADLLSRCYCWWLAGSRLA